MSARSPRAPPHCTIIRAGESDASRLTASSRPKAIMSRSIATPSAIVTAITEPTYTEANRAPNWLMMMAMVPVEVAGAGHQEDERRTGAEPLGDQGRGDGGAGGGADVERDAHEHHDRIGDPARVLAGHEVVRDGQVEHAAERQAHQQGEEDVVGDVDESVAQDVLADGGEGEAAQVSLGRARRGGCNFTRRPSQPYFVAALLTGLI